ncbi:unnamed protein product [Parajaminaea phylloscopi]
MASLIKSITLEEHFTSQAALALPPPKDDPSVLYPPALKQKLADVGAKRIEDMARGGVALQVISHTPDSNAPLDVIRAGNDELAAAVAKHPTRFAAFAQLPMGDATAARDELQRCVRELGFVGALVDNHCNGNFYDTTEYDVLWDRAVQLDVPVYLHPAWPSDDMNKAFFAGGGLAERPHQAIALGAFAFGWHASTAITVLRLITAGVFDRHPKLKIVIGHTGELLPFMFERTGRVLDRLGLQRGFREVMHNNVWITTSGMFELHSLRCLLEVMPRSHVLFSIDYPFSDNEAGQAFLQEIEKEGVLTGDDLVDFARRNAQRLLGVRAG